MELSTNTLAEVVVHLDKLDIATLCLTDKNLHKRLCHNYKIWRYIIKHYQLEPQWDNNPMTFYLRSFGALYFGDLDLTFKSFQPLLNQV